MLIKLKLNETQKGFYCIIFYIFTTLQRYTRYFNRDPLMLWTAAPKPLMRAEAYNTAFWDWTIEERVKRMHNYEFCIKSECEPMFDAADCLLKGDVMFVQQSMVRQC